MRHARRRARFHRLAPLRFRPRSAACTATTGADFSLEKSLPCRFCGRNPQDFIKIWRGWPWPGSLIPRPPAFPCGYISAGISRSAFACLFQRLTNPPWNAAPLGQSHAQPAFAKTRSSIRSATSPALPTHSKRQHRPIFRCCRYNAIISPTE